MDVLESVNPILSCPHPVSSSDAFDHRVGHLVASVEEGGAGPEGDGRQSTASI